MEVDVQEYCESESDESVSDYDSYDGEAGWRDGESEDGEADGDGDSMTDPESVRSECSSPVEGKEDEDKEAGYFGLMPLTPLVGGVGVC